MSFIHHARAKKKREEKENNKDYDSSPVHTVLGSLAGDTASQSNLAREMVGERRRKVDRRPDRIEEVPFRRQDQRTLNAKNRRDMDKKLILFIVTCGLFLIFLGSILLVFYSLYHTEYKDVRPAIVIGPVLLAGGLMTLLCSVEVCLRLYRETKREPDSDLDNLANPHEVKHWMDPKIIPYGWGLFGDEDEVIVIEEDTNSVEMAEIARS